MNTTKTQAEIRVKRKELLEETIGFFNTDKLCRSDDGGCFYHMEGKAGCAIGRKLSVELAKELDVIGNEHDGDSGVTEEYIFEKLPFELQELGGNFLSSIQDLHDNKYYWDENGLTEKGKGMAQIIQKNFCE